jgi:hypothetical protein
MSSHARIRRSAPSITSRASGRQLAPVAIQHSRPASRIPQTADQKKAKAAPNPLWAIAIGMGVFFAAAALLMMFD